MANVKSSVIAIFYGHTNKPISMSSFLLYDIRSKF